MAYTLRNTGVLRPKKGRRYVHRRLALKVDGTGAASGTVNIPVPARLVGIQYGLLDGTNPDKALTVATSGALVVKCDTTDGVQIFTDADLSSVPTGFLPVGTVAVDQGRAATAATDGFSGGFPVRSGAFASIASGTENEVVIVDFMFRLCTYVHTDLISQTGADGAGAETLTIRTGGPGSLAAVALDFQNMPNTTDIVIKADSTNGPALFTSTSSNTDLAPSLIGRPGADEAVNASAATDGTEGCNGFMHGLFISMAEADAFTSANEKVVVELWIDD